MAPPPNLWTDQPRPWSLAIKPCIHGPNFEGSRFNGIHWNTLKRYPNAITLLSVLGTTVGFAVFMLARAALKSPDVSWDRKHNPEPWNAYRHKRYQLFHLSDDSFPDCPAPEYQ